MWRIGSFLLIGVVLSSTLLMVNDLCQSFCFITWQHLLRGRFLFSTLLFNGQWSVPVFLFYNMTTPKLPLNRCYQLIKQKDWHRPLTINNVEDRKIPLNRCCQVIKQKDWHTPLTINNVEDRKLTLTRCCQVIKQTDWRFIKMTTSIKRKFPILHIVI
jgi:mRNA-degrading endonuclease HigB of HigAB toxin-antitoxin module